MGGRSSSAPAPTETRVTQSDLPEYVHPYFERLMGNRFQQKKVSYLGAEKQKEANLLIVKTVGKLADNKSQYQEIPLYQLL